MAQRTIKVQCGENINVEQILDEVFEKLKSGYNCNAQYAKHSEKLKEAGKAKSTNNAAKIISEETGESQTAVRSKIQRGEVAQRAQDNQQPVIVEDSKSNVVCEKVKYDKEFDQLCSKLRGVVLELKRTAWTLELREFVLKRLHKIVVTAAKK